MSDFRSNLPKIDISNFDFSKTNNSQHFNQNLQASIEENRKKVNDVLNKSSQRQNEQFEATVRTADNIQSIADDMKGIQELIGLVRHGNFINQQTFELLQEMQTIMIAQSQEEAESIFQQVLDKAEQTNQNVETIKSLVIYGKMIKGAIFQHFGIE